VSSIIVATWQFGKEACDVGGDVLAQGGIPLDAVERGANAVELNPEVMSVGYGGLPNAEGVVELDAAIMDGPAHNAGCALALTGIRQPISVARSIMESCPHTLLAGDNARRFALEHGFTEEETLTDAAKRRWEEWRANRTASTVAHFEADSHDTVGVIALDARGDLAVGCTTSGMAWKVPGRAGDSPIIGSGLYVDNEVGAAVSTGNGDEIMKVCLSYRVVTLMERGADPQTACEEAIRYLLRKLPNIVFDGAACLAVAKDGRIGQAATQIGFSTPDRPWLYAVRRSGEATELREGVYIE